MAVRTAVPTAINVKLKIWSKLQQRKINHTFFFQFENIYKINPYPHHSLSAFQPLNTKTVISARYSFQASETSDNFFLLIIANLLMQLFYL